MLQTDADRKDFAGALSEVSWALSQIIKKCLNQPANGKRERNEDEEMEGNNKKRKRYSVWFGSYE